MLLEAENVQQEEEGGQPETGIRTPTGRGGETQTGKQDEVTEVRTTSKKINTFLNDKKNKKSLINVLSFNLQCFFKRGFQECK